MKQLYRLSPDWALRHRRVVLGAAVVLVMAGVLLFTSLGAEFVPRLSEGTIVINLVRLAGVSLDQAVAHNARVEQILLEKFPDKIEHIWTRTGSAELATDRMGIELADVFVALTPRAHWKKAKSQQELVTAINAELADIPGMNRAFTQPIEMRANEMIPGVRADVGVKIFGDDLPALEQKAEEIAALIRLIPGSAEGAELADAGRRREARLARKKRPRQ